MNTARMGYFQGPRCKAGPLAWNGGGVGAFPPGFGVVEGRTASYRPEALAKEKREKMEANWIASGSALCKCFLPGGCHGRPTCRFQFKFVAIAAVRVVNLRICLSPHAL